MVSLYGLFILLLTAEAIHAQGNKNDGDGVDHASGSKDATSLPLGTTLQPRLQPYRKVTHRIKAVHLHMWILNQEKECKGGHGVRKLSKSCSQQQSPS
ncbi:hypothetical protein BASA61_010547 [Batrachochytrium salamandrivorans]|nr:hypothetical protein BASA61_010547 [Batrachochytrium salamandrivorans]